MLMIETKKTGTLKGPGPKVTRRLSVGHLGGPTANKKYQNENQTCNVTDQTVYSHFASHLSRFWPERRASYPDVMGDIIRPYPINVNYFHVKKVTIKGINRERIFINTT